MTAVFIAVTGFVTALISGIFGMAGGLVLMGALGFVLTVPEAMALHGLIQMTSNGSRAVFHLRHVRWAILGLYAAGALGVGVLFAAVTYTPSKAALYLLLGAVPLVTWLPKERLHLDAARPLHAALCGGLIGAMQLLAGVAGPMLDIFFVRSAMSRHQIVATKAATQVVSHAIKIVYYGGALLASAPAEARGVGVFFLLTLPFTLAGTWTGSHLLERFTDDGFRTWSRRIVTAIGAVYLVRGVLLLAG
jgi:uncharacterized membrane protein YfcA